MDILKINFMLLNKTLIGVLSFLILLSLINISQKQNFDKYANINTNSVLKSPAKNIEEFKELTYYLSTVKLRNIFSFSLKKDNTNFQFQTPDESFYKINAIYQEDNHFEAVLMDKNNKKTFFIKEGDLVNGCSVKKITSQKVALQCGSNEMELL